MVPGGGGPHRGISVLGQHVPEPLGAVVCATAAPDHGGDLFAWAEGCGPLRRNGRALQGELWPAAPVADRTALTMLAFP